MRNLWEAAKTTKTQLDAGRSLYEDHPANDSMQDQEVLSDAALWYLRHIQHDVAVIKTCVSFVTCLIAIALLVFLADMLYSDWPGAAASFRMA